MAKILADFRERQTEQAETEKIGEAAEAAPEYDEADLERIAEQIDARIDGEQARVLEAADKKIDSAPVLSGLDAQKAQSIFTAGGFATRIKGIKDKIAALAQGTKSKVADTSPRRDTPASPKEKTLDRYVADIKKPGLDGAREKANLLQLRMQGIKKPEQVLGLARYLEENATQVETRMFDVPKTEASKITKEAAKLREQGFEVHVTDNYTDETKADIRATKETAYSFSPGSSKWLAKDLDEISRIPGDPVKVIEALRGIGYRVEIGKGHSLALSNSYELKNLLSDPNALPLLEKLRTFGGANMTHDFFKDYDGLRTLSHLASEDGANTIYTPAAERGIEKVAAIFGEPINFRDVEAWSSITQDETAMEILPVLLQENPKGSKPTARECLHTVQVIRERGVEAEVAELFRYGFNEKSLGQLFYPVESISEQAAKNLRAATEAFRANPQLCELARGLVKLSDVEDPLSQENMGRLQPIAEKIPAAGHALENMADLGIHTSKWEIAPLLANSERLSKYGHILEAVAEPNFKTFAAACEKAGYTFTFKDVFSGGNTDYNHLERAYRNEGFRTAVLSEQGMALAQHIGIFEKPSNDWNMWALSSLSEIPDALTSLKKLEESYGYKYSTNDDYGNYKLANLAATLRKPELCSRLFNPKTIETIKLAGAQFGIQFSLDNPEETIKIGEDLDVQAALQDPETIAFVRSGLTESNMNIKTVAVLAKCDPTLRPAIATVIAEFGYVPEATYTINLQYDEEKEGFVNKPDLQLKDHQRLEELRDDPVIFEAQARLAAAGITKNPLDEPWDIKRVAKQNLFTVFEQFKGSPRIQEFMWHNLETAAALSKMSPEKIPTYLEIFTKIDDSPSQEIQRLKGSLLSQLVESPHPVEDYQAIESIFIKNNIPMVGKVFGVFETLHDPSKLKQEINVRTSPVLQQASTRKRYHTIYQDLLKIHIDSGNRSLKEYAEVLQSGGRLIDQYERGGIESLSEHQQDELRYFVGKIETLQAKSALDTADDAFRIASTAGLSERVAHVKEGLMVAEGQTILERISDMYLRPAGLENLGQLLEQMRAAKTMADQRGRQIATEGTVSLKGGDLLKGVDEKYIANILQNGSVAKEFLGASSGSDMTPFDTDVSLVMPEDAKGRLRDTIESSIAKGYGQILFALRDRGQYQHTEPGQPAKTEPGKIELFRTGVVEERHYGIRTGFPTTEIDFMVAQSDLASRPQDLEKLYFEIAQNGYYTPVADSSGKVIFTPEMYDEYRKSFAGLEKFDAPPLDFHTAKTGDQSYDRVREISAAVPEDSRRVEQTSKIIYDEVKQALGGLGVNLRAEFDTGILGAELLDTGSTGRHTNAPGDFDFDLSLKLDAKDFPRATELAQAIKGTMTFSGDNSHLEGGGYYQLRVKGVTSIGGQRMDKPLDIDIGFAKKSDLTVYGSHDAIRDKLGYIRAHDGEQAYEQTVANVILAKQVLKAGHAYKKLEDGGFGGVGVENWILANGGNMEEAFRSFRGAAYENGQRVPYERFREKYKILDPGTNIKFQGHDNFISILKPVGYEKMLDTIDGYFGEQA